jgi:hypothetical protein
MHSEENGSLRFAIMPSPGTPRLAPYLAFTRLWLHWGFSRVIYFFTLRANSE